MRIKGVKLLKYDFFIIAIIIIFAVISFIIFLPQKHDFNNVEIYLNGNLIHSSPLNTDIQKTIEIGGKYPSTVQISGNNVAITASTCADHICENTGKISKSGDVIVCLPNRLLVQIVGDKPSEYDAVVG